MMRWPDFFIVGAPRTGTTSLYYHLKGHPGIYMPSLKEPNFLNEFNNTSHNERRRSLPVGTPKTESAYLKLFQNVKPNQIIGEASTTYLASIVAPVRIKEKNPQAKIIAVLRDPVSCAYSFYLQSVREGWERRSTFYEALQEDYEYMLSSSGEGSSFYLWPSLYYQHVRRYLDTFGQEQVRIYLYEDLESDTAAVVKDLCSFLGVTDYDGRFFDPNRKYNTYGTHRNPVFTWAGRNKAMRSLAAAVAPMHLLILLRDRLVDHQQPKPPLDHRSREFLRPIFHNDIVKLEDLINRDLGSWLA